MSHWLLARGVRAAAWAPRPPPRVVRGDATRAEDVDRALALARGGAGARLADAIITDPPYCLLERRQRDGSLRAPSRSARARPIHAPSGVTRFESVAAHAAFTRAWLAVALPRLRPGGVLAVWTNPLGRGAVAAAASAAACTTIGEFVWARSARAGQRVGGAGAVAAGTGDVFLRAYESALVFRKGGEVDVDVDRVRGDDARVPWAVVSGYREGEDDDEGEDDGEGGLGERGGGECRSDAREPRHPHAKPRAAMEPLVRSWSARGDVVLDPFAGSGGCVAAAVACGRDGVGLEADGEWAERAAAAAAAAEQRPWH